VVPRPKIYIIYFLYICCIYGGQIEAGKTKSRIVVILSLTLLYSRNTARVLESRCAS